MGNGSETARKRRLGALEMRVLGYAQSRRLSVVRIGELRERLSLTTQQERDVFSRLARAGTIVRLKREVYLLPAELPAGGVWSVSPYRILVELMSVSGDGSYQLCGWETFRAYSLTDQVSNRVYVYNNRLSGDRAVGGHAFTFIKVADSRLGGVEPSTTPDGVEIRMPSLPRVLMDAVYDWSRFDTLPAAYQWIRAAGRKDPSVVDDLAALTCRFSNQSTLRRIGFVLSELGLKGARSRKMRAALRSSKALVPLVPRAQALGRVDTTWGVIVNE